MSKNNFSNKNLEDLNNQYVESINALSTAISLTMRNIEGVNTAIQTLVDSLPSTDMYTSIANNVSTVIDNLIKSSTLKAAMDLESSRISLLTAALESLKNIDYSNFCDDFPLSENVSEAANDVVYKMPVIDHSNNNKSSNNPNNNSFLVRKNKWTRSEILALIGIIVGVITALFQNNGNATNITIENVDVNINVSTQNNDDIGIAKEFIKSFYNLIQVVNDEIPELLEDTSNNQ